MASALSALKRLHRVHLEAADIPSLLADLAAQSDRGTAIMLCGFTESALAQVIKTRLSHVPPDTLFGEHRVLYSFENKMVIGQALGIYGPRSAANLKIIKETRNFFAHSSTSVNFETIEVERYIDTMDTTLYDLANGLFEGQIPALSRARRHFSVNTLILLTSLLVNEVIFLKSEMRNVQRKVKRMEGEQSATLPMSAVEGLNAPEFQRLLKWIPQPLP